MDINKAEEFDNGLKINFISFLKIALETGSIWTSRVPDGFTLIIRDFYTKDDKRYVGCDVEGHDIDMHVEIKNLLKGYSPPSISFEFVGPIEYGVTCSKCKRDYQYQKKAIGFVCWACKRGY